MARCLRLALLALVAGCVDLAPPPPVTTDGAEPEPWDAAAMPEDVPFEDTDTSRPDVPDPTPPDAAGDGPPAGEPDGSPPLPLDGGIDAVVLLVNGAPCSSGPVCQSGVCSEGVCCDQVCGQLCRSCKVAGSEGRCTAAPVGGDPRLECVAQAPSTCGRAGGCDGMGACRLHPVDTVCLAARCTGSTETEASTCDGRGTCSPGASSGCGAYLCSGSSCGDSCTTGAQCASGNVCLTGGCVPSASLPELYWQFDEASGGTALDGSGNGHHGSYTGSTSTPQPSTDVPGLMFPNPRSRAFSIGNRAAVRLANMPAALRPSNNLTVTAWYKATRVDTDHPEAGSDLVSAGDQYMLRVRTGDILFVKRTLGGFPRCEGPLANPLDGRWHHVAGITSSVGMRVYIDGQLACTNTDNEAISYAAGPDLWVGRHGDLDTDRDFDGQIDDVRIYNRVLSASEIAALAAGMR